MRLRILFLALSVASAMLLPVAVYWAWSLQAKFDDLGNFAAILIKRDAGIDVKTTLTDREIAMRIRDWVYRGFRPGVQPEGLECAEYYALLHSSSNEMLCDGAAGAYLWALETVGIPARFVDLADRGFLAGGDEHNTHTTVEVYLDGGWEISDPTFNVSFDCSDGTKKLSTPRAKACIDGGASLIERPGLTQIGGRTVGEYYAPIESFFVAWRRDKVTYSSVREPMDEYPYPGWLDKQRKRYEEIRRVEASASPNP